MEIITKWIWFFMWMVIVVKVESKGYQHLQVGTPNTRHSPKIQEHLYEHYLQSKLFDHPKKRTMVNVTLAVDRVPAEPVPCKRRDVLNKLQTALKTLEEPPYIFPMPKAMLRGEKCECLKPPEHGRVTYSPTSCLDGGPAIPFKMVDKSSKIKWSPKYPVPCQNAHPRMACYCVPQVFNPDLCDCPDGDKIKHLYKTKDPNVGAGEMDYCTSGKDVYYCPPDPNHKHWSPYKGSCVWPRPCIAQCFDHSDRRDWINVVPNYNYYMQQDKMFEF